MRATAAVQALVALPALAAESVPVWGAGVRRSAAQCLQVISRWWSKAVSEPLVKYSTIVFLQGAALLQCQAIAARGWVQGCSSHIPLKERRSTSTVPTPLLTLSATTAKARYPEALATVPAAARAQKSRRR